MHCGNTRNEQRLQRRSVLTGAAAAAGATCLGTVAPAALAASSGAASGIGATQALMADLAADVPGVNTHINYLRTIYDTGYATIVKPRLL